MSLALAAALNKFLDGSVAASSFTAAQRRALDEFARTTGALRVKSEGRGSVYQVVNTEIFNLHLRTLRPSGNEPLDQTLPVRATNIARTRDSKGAAHRHECQYLPVKAISDDVTWLTENSLRSLDLSAATNNAGVGMLSLTVDDTWQSAQPLWLVENQALFDRLDWLPPGACGTIAYYAGQLPTRLLQWLKTSPRTPEVILFPDYDGVGLLNYARLKAASASPCSFWLMPDWHARLVAFGNREVWRNTQSEFQSAQRMFKTTGIDDDLANLCSTLSSEGLALEQESVWLSIPC
ncbi:MAG: hypothetical protein PHP85_13295 [Gallionella sp.]|nr:hypothetical protein [Gallionella sp.]